MTMFGTASSLFYGFLDGFAWPSNRLIERIGVSNVIVFFHTDLLLQFLGFQSSIELLTYFSHLHISRLYTCTNLSNQPQNWSQPLFRIGYYLHFVHVHTDIHQFIRVSTANCSFRVQLLFSTSIFDSCSIFSKRPCCWTIGGSSQV